MGNDSKPLTNGETTRSKALSHLHSYPFIHDTTSFLASTPLGSRTLNLAHTTYNSLITPLHPYLQRPYTIASPYLTRADELGDTSLTKLEAYVPVMREDTETLKGYAVAPYNYVSGTYQQQYERTGGQGGLVKTGLAALSTQLQIAQDAFGVVREFWNTSEARKKVDGKLEQTKQ